MAESFGTDVARYDRARPRYPDALVKRIAAESPGPAILDVGCGTGIEARQFQAAGCVVLGVEPDARMADFARAHALEVEVATFEAWEPAGRTFDALGRSGGRGVPARRSNEPERRPLDVYEAMYGLRDSGCQRGA